MLFFIINYFFLDFGSIGTTQTIINLSIWGSSMEFDLKLFFGVIVIPLGNLAKKLNCYLVVTGFCKNALD